MNFDLLNRLADELYARLLDAHRRGDTTRGEFEAGVYDIGDTAAELARADDRSLLD